MAQQQQRSHWLDKYANNHAVWKESIAPNGNQAFQRPLGLVETSFDADGTYYGGRAGMYVSFLCNLQLHFALFQTMRNTFSGIPEPNQSRYQLTVS